MLDKQYALLSEQMRARAADYLVHAATTKPDPLETAVYFLSLAPEDLRPPIVARWRNLLTDRVKPDDPIFGPWYELFAIPPERLPVEAPLIFDRWKARPSAQVNPLVVDALAKTTLNTRADVARAYGNLLKRLYDESKSAKEPMPDPIRD